MITLYQFPPGFGLPNASPFCMKVETYLRMAGLRYRLDNRGLVLRAPKGKLPFIEDGTERIADSGLIIDYLKGRYGDPLDAELDSGQRACATAFQRLMEEHLYWAVLYTRWFTPSGWALTRDVFFGGMRWPLGAIVPPLARRGLRRQLWGHGMGRHPEDQIMALGRADILAVAEFLADKPFLLGDRPSAADACAFAFLANLLWAPLESPLKLQAAALPNLDAYCRRMQARYFDDMPPPNDRAAPR